jgi:hypothetical protein
MTEGLVMSITYRLVHEALELGYLSIEAEKQLQQLCCVQLGLEDDLDILLLRQAIAFGHVKRQALQVKRTARKDPFTCQAA